jgi:hypothetical protein
MEHFHHAGVGLEGHDPVGALGQLPGERTGAGTQIDGGPGRRTEDPLDG